MIMNGERTFQPGRVFGVFTRDSQGMVGVSFCCIFQDSRFDIHSTQCGTALL